MVIIAVCWILKLTDRCEHKKNLIYKLIVSKIRRFAGSLYLCIQWWDLWMLCFKRNELFLSSILFNKPKNVSSLFMFQFLWIIKIPMLFGPLKCLLKTDLIFYNVSIKYMSNNLNCLVWLKFQKLCLEFPSWMLFIKESSISAFYLFQY